MTAYIFKIITLLGGLSLFLFGMVQDHLQQDHFQFLVITKTYMHVVKQALQ